MTRIWGAFARIPIPVVAAMLVVVFERIPAGHANEAIALRLGISVRTVQNHVSSVLLKLGVATRAAAVARARAAGIGGAGSPVGQ